LIGIDRTKTPPDPWRARPEEINGVNGSGGNDLYTDVKSAAMTAAFSGRGEQAGSRNY